MPNCCCSKLFCFRDFFFFWKRVKVTKLVLYVTILVMVLLGIKWTSALYALCVGHCTQVRFSELEKTEQPSPTVPVSRQEILL